MKIMKRSVISWIIVGTIVSLCTLAAVAYGANSSPAVLVDSAVITQAAEQVLECARSGDYDRLGQMLYGAPSLGTSPEKTDDAQSMIWFAFLDSIQYELSEECYALDSGLAMDVRVNCLDISAVTDSLQAIAPEMLKQRAEEADSEEAIYDEEHNYREDFISEVLQSATAQVLSEQPQTIDQEFTLRFARWNGQWQVVPTEELLQFLSGFVSG